MTRSELDGGVRTLAAGSFAHTFAADAIGTDAVELPASLIFAGSYERHGFDIVVSEPFLRCTVRDFFRPGAHAGFVSPDGARLDHARIVALTHGAFGPQVAANDHVPAGPKAIGRVETVTGGATAIRNGVTVELHKGDLVLKGDAVETDAQGALAITLIDGTAFNLTASARMVLDDMVYEPGGASNSALLSLVEGSISFVAGQVAHTGDMKVDTPVATMGIRGTAVHADIDAAHGRTRFSVMREPDGRVGRYVLIDHDDPTRILATVGDAGTMLVLERDHGQLLIDSVAKTPLDLQSERSLVDQVFQTLQLGQDNPLAQQLQQMEQHGPSSHGSSVVPSPGGATATDTGQPSPAPATAPETAPMPAPAVPIAPVPPSAAPTLPVPPADPTSGGLSNLAQTLPEQPALTVAADAATVARDGSAAEPASGGLLRGASAGEVVTGIHAAMATAFTPVASSGTTTVAGSLGTLSVAADGAFSYAADHDGAVSPGRLGTDTFTFAVADGSGGTATSTLTVSVDGGTAASYAAVEVAQGASATVTPSLASPEGGDRFALVGAPEGGTAEAGAHGTAVIDQSTGAITYTAAAVGAGGTDTFTVSDTDALGVTTTATASFATPPPGTTHDTWLGTVSDDWNNGANWSEGAPPMTGEQASIPSGTAYDPSVVSGTTVKIDDVTVANQGTIAVGPDGSDAVLVLRDGSAIDGSGIMIYGHGRLDVEAGPDAMGDALNGVDAVTNQGTISVGSGAVLTLNGTVIAGGEITNAGAIHVAGSTIIEGGADLDGGTVALAGGSTLSLFDTAAHDATVGFAAGALLALDLQQPFTATLSGFTTGDALDLTGFDPGGATASWTQGAGGSGTLTVTDDAGATAQFTLAGTYDAADFLATADSADPGAAIAGGGTDVLYVDRWTGSSGDWDTAAAWRHGVPTAGTAAVIDAEGIYTVTLVAADSAAALFVNDADATVQDGTGASLTLGGELTVEAGIFDLAGGALAAAAIAIAGGATLEGGGTLSAPVANAGLIEATGALDLAGALSGNGTLAVAPGATLELAGGNTQDVAFVNNDGGGPDATLRLDAPETFTATVAGIEGTHEVIDLIGFDASDSTATTGAGSYNSDTGLTTLSVSDPSLDEAVTINLQGDYSGSTWTVTDDGHGGIDVVDPPGAASGATPRLAARPHAAVAALVKGMLDPDGDTFAFKAVPGEALAGHARPPSPHPGLDMHALAQGDTFVFKADPHDAGGIAHAWQPGSPEATPRGDAHHALAQAASLFHEASLAMHDAQAGGLHHADVAAAHVEHFHL